MKNLKRRAIATAAAMFVLVPAAATAEPLTNFHNYVAPGMVMTNAGFDNANIEIIGASVVVRGRIGGVETVKIIQFAGTGASQTIDLGSGVDRDRPPPPPSPEKSAAAPLAVAVALSSCGASEAILYEGPEYYYYIKWCKLQGATSPKKAKKNYYYMFANGSPLHVATLEYFCNNSADTGAMPPAVYSGSC